MNDFETYQRILTDATSAGHREYEFWRALIEAHEIGRLDIDAVRNLIDQSSIFRSKPSRATAYRQLERWSEILTELKNPGRGA